MRGAGKTTLGRLAAVEMGRSFVDVDEWLEAQWRCSCKDVRIYYLSKLSLT